MARALDFCRNAVWLSLEAEGPAFSFLAAGAIRIALNEVAKTEADATGAEIVLEAEDVNAAFETVQERGVPFALAPRPVMTAGERTLPAAHFSNPDGHPWSVTGSVDTTLGEPAS